MISLRILALLASLAWNAWAQTETVSTGTTLPSSLGYLLQGRPVVVLAADGTPISMTKLGRIVFPSFKRDVSRLPAANLKSLPVKTKVDLEGEFIAVWALDFVHVDAVLPVLPDFLCGSPEYAPFFRILCRLSQSSETSSHRLTGSTSTVGSDEHKTISPASAPTSTKDNGPKLPTGGSHDGKSPRTVHDLFEYIFTKPAEVFAETVFLVQTLVVTKTVIVTETVHYTTIIVQLSHTRDSSPSTHATSKSQQGMTITGKGVNLPSSKSSLPTAVSRTRSTPPTPSVPTHVSSPTSTTTTSREPSTGVPGTKIPSSRTDSSSQLCATTRSPSTPTVGRAEKSKISSQSPRRSWEILLAEWSYMLSLCSKTTSALSTHSRLPGGTASTQTRREGGEKADRPMPAAGIRQPWPSQTGPNSIP